MFSITADQNRVLYDAEGNHVSFCFLDSDPESVRRFCSRIKTQIRKNPDFKLFMKLQKRAHNTCAFFKNVNTSNARIELHHAPFSLAEIIEIVVVDKLSNGQVIPEALLIYEVIAIHFNNWIGLSPLSETAHQLIESKKYRMSRDKITGNVEILFEKYPAGASALHNTKLGEWRSNVNDMRLVADTLTYTGIRDSNNEKLDQFIKNFKPDAETVNM